MARPPAFDTDVALMAAVDTFWRHGYSGSSMQRLLDAMKLNRGSLYNSFGDKRELFLASMDRYFQVFSVAVIQLLDNSPQPVRGLLEVFEITMLGLTPEFRQRGCLLVNSMAELGDNDPELAGYARRLSGQVQSAFARALERAKKQGFWTQPHLDTQLTADLLFNFMTGLRVTTRIQNNPAKLRQVVLHSFHALGLDFESLSPIDRRPHD